MYWQIIKGDLRRNKIISAVILLCIVAASALVALTALLVAQTLGAVDGLMTQAETPHYEWMHKGDVDMAQIEAFAVAHPNVDEYQVLEFLNIEGENIVINGQSQGDSINDNGLCTQSGLFDYLIDTDGQIIQVSDGEIYLPMDYTREGLAAVGDEAIINGRSFTVAGFARDAQMNSSLSGSKRMLISEADYAALRPEGDLEYFVQFRLKDLNGLAALREAYQAAGLPTNGTEVDYQTFMLLNTLSDGIMIAIILLVAVLVAVIAFLCIRFTLLAKIEDEYREIGVLKAIGMRVSQIKRCYMAKYAAMAVVGGALGFLVSLAARGPLLESIRLYYGEGGNAALALGVGAAGVVLVCLIIVGYVSHVLNRFKRISPAQAVRFGTMAEKAAPARRMRLATSRIPSVNVFLGFKDILCRKRLYVTMLATVAVAAFIMILPLNLLSTMQAPAFVRIMGNPESNLLVNARQPLDELAAQMEADPEITRWGLYETKSVQALSADGTRTRLQVDTGDHVSFPVLYAEGQAPARGDEIALSLSLADELGFRLGDEITLFPGGQERAFLICGIYGELNNGGKTAKATGEAFSADDSVRHALLAITAEGSNEREVADRYADAFPFARVIDMTRNTNQTLGPTLAAVGLGAIVAAIVGLALTALITLLFVKMLVAKDRFVIAAMRSFGFTKTDIRTQYIARSALVLLLGCIIGTVLANTLGQALVGAFLASMGAAAFQFISNVFAAYILCPLALACAAIAATLGGTLDVRNIHIADNIKE
jgi:putative ABC transport system permease protein